MIVSAASPFSLPLPGAGLLLRNRPALRAELPAPEALERLAAS